MTKKDELYEQLLAEKERVILVLTDTIDYLKAELSVRPRTFSDTTNVRSEVEGFDPNNFLFEMTGGAQAWVSEEEQDIKAMVANGTLTEEEAHAALLEILGDARNDVLA